ncbi:acyltransferase [uncultured Microbacterium sp.]|uniref:acyltransferase family protein n=1 Tax=uncultured Microbacterium sp. TaxID=191216 RepID=UPI0025DDE2E4|nr:acyltransferase [uncultured Microbacterium sp.]
MFDPRRNAIGFLRWFLAFLVIFSHAGPVAGFFGGKDLGTQWSSEQSFGGVAVSGFFFLSGFLITRSKMGRSTTLRFLWHRVLRIYPGFFLILICTAFVFAPVAWLAEKGTMAGFWDAPVASPLTYFLNNFTLVMRQIDIAGMGTSTPLFSGHGILDWNGSAWTLAFEFACYLMVAALGVFGALGNRIVATVFAGVIIGFSMMQWLGFGNLVAVSGVFNDFRVLLLFAPFAWGMLFYLHRDKVPIDDRIGVACAAVAIVTYVKGGWLVIGQYAFCYALLWFAIRATKLSGWDRRGDFSYGIYISGWPIMWLATYFHVQDFGFWPYILLVIVACHLYAWLSWHLVEKPALDLKSWTPRWLTRLIDGTRERRNRLRDRVRSRLVLSNSEASR